VYIVKASPQCVHCVRHNGISDGKAEQSLVYTEKASPQCVHCVHIV
jgi:hypothetical protein